jgi:hypothetical protein
MVQRNLRRDHLLRPEQYEFVGPGDDLLTVRPRYSTGCPSAIMLKCSPSIFPSGSVKRLHRRTGALPSLRNPTCATTFEPVGFSSRTRTAIFGCLFGSIPANVLPCIRMSTMGAKLTQRRLLPSTKYSNESRSPVPWQDGLRQILSILRTVDIILRTADRIKMRHFMDERARLRILPGRWRTWEGIP